MSDNETNKSDESHDQPLIDDAVKENVKSRNTWLRLFYMILFGLIMGLAEFVLVFVVIIQFFTVLLSGERNDKLLAFGADLACYVYDIWRYLSFVTEEQPFPFGEWRRADDARKASGEVDTNS